MAVSIRAARLGRSKSTAACCRLLPAANAAEECPSEFTGDNPLLIEVETGNYFTIFLRIVYRFQQRMACVIEEANYLLASIDNFMVAYTTGIGQGHSASFRIFNDILNADKQVLHFTRLLTDGLRQNN